MTAKSKHTPPERDPIAGIMIRAAGGQGDALAGQLVQEKEVSRSPRYCAQAETLSRAAYHALHAMPSRHTQEYLKPLLEALRSPAADVKAPRVAGRILCDWKVKYG